MLDIKDFGIEFNQANSVQSVLGILQALAIFIYLFFLRAMQGFFHNGNRI